ncbi:helix-turn-helix domain-containing protein [Desulfovibrio sp. 1188_IL3213]|uniref:helix-turn-helix domain-containing protein n=1 Tax=Desulfovibrio sp. 1188_IL3213 TaxID=3084052 RepID=UPI003FA5AC72
MDELCESLVRSTLEASGGNVSKAADALGIARTTLYRKMRKYGLGRKKQAEAPNGNEGA